MEWPTYYPEDCPPASAMDIEAVELYRLVDHNPPADGDFIPHKLKFPRKKYYNECKACGLSVFTKVEDIIKLRDEISALGNKLIAKGKLPPGMGKILHTPRWGNSHHTLWIPDNAQIEKFFEVMT
jgi:hypothetical protein